MNDRSHARTTIYVEPSLLKAVKKKMLDTGVRYFNTLVTALLREWLEGEAHQRAVKAEQASPIDRLVNRALAAGATEEEIEAALSTVITLARRRSARARRARGA